MKTEGFAMKRIVCLFLCLVMCCMCFAGCGKDKEKQETADLPEEYFAEDLPLTQNDGEPEEFGFDKERIVLVTEGEKWILYDGGLNYDEVTWISDDPAVATFENGVVTAVASGQTNVHAEYRGERFSCEVVCNIRFLEGTDPEYIDQILDYTVHAEHDDAPDSAACICRVLDNGYYM